MTSDNELRDRIADSLHGHFELDAIGPMGCRHEQGSDEEHVADVMLEVLRTDEAVERVAEAIYRSHDSYTHFTAKPWAEMVKSKDRANKFRVKQDRNAARAAITALLEHEPRP